eukprot:509324_1
MKTNHIYKQHKKKALNECQLNHKNQANQAKQKHKIQIQTQPNHDTNPLTHANVNHHNENQPQIQTTQKDSTERMSTESQKSSKSSKTKTQKTNINTTTLVPTSSISSDVNMSQESRTINDPNNALNPVPLPPLNATNSTHIQMVLKTTEPINNNNDTNSPNYYN